MHRFASLTLMFLSTAVWGEGNRDMTIEPLGEMRTEQRVALVVGNGEYASVPLRNPANDARAIAAALRSCGFTAIERIDCGKRDMVEAIRDFERRIQKGGVGLFYYAGHGMPVRGRNYLVPVDSDVREENEAEFECIDASLVLRKMEDAGNRVNIMILDACRDNPFARSFRSS